MPGRGAAEVPLVEVRRLTNLAHSSVDDVLELFEVRRPLAFPRPLPLMQPN